jgi:hypothetical protein
MHPAAMAGSRCEAGSSALIKAALTGSIEHTSSGRRTQRYQQLVVLALLACHDAGHS